MTTTEITPDIIAELGFTPVGTAFDARLIAQSKYWMGRGKLVETASLTAQELRDAITHLRADAANIELRLAWYVQGARHHGRPNTQNLTTPVRTSPLMGHLVALEQASRFAPQPEDKFLVETYAAIEADPIKRLALSWVALSVSIGGSSYILTNVRWNLQYRQYPECSPSVRTTIADLRTAIDMLEGLVGFDGPHGTPSLRDVLDRIARHGGSVEPWSTPGPAREAILELWREVPAFSIHAVAEAPKVHFRAL